MAGVICPSCDGVNPEGEAFCLFDGFELTGAPRVTETRNPAEPPAMAADQPAEPMITCPHCDADVPDPTNAYCVTCLEELAPAVQTPQPAAALARRDAAPPQRLTLLFDNGHRLEVTATEQVLLGRDAASPCAGQLAATDHVSRRHASVGVEPDGAAWVRDEYSTNGTYLNDSRLPPGRRAPLGDGDVLRLAADVTASVRQLDAEGPP